MGKLHSHTWFLGKLFKASRPHSVYHSIWVCKCGAIKETVHLQLKQSKAKK